MKSICRVLNLSYSEARQILPFFYPFRFVRTVALPMPYKTAIIYIPDKLCAFISMPKPRRQCGERESERERGREIEMNQGTLNKIILRTLFIYGKRREYMLSRWARGKAYSGGSNIHSHHDDDDDDGFRLPQLCISTHTHTLKYIHTLHICISNRHTILLTSPHQNGVHPRH